MDLEETIALKPQSSRVLVCQLSKLGRNSVQSVLNKCDKYNLIYQRE